MLNSKVNSRFGRAIAAAGLAAVMIAAPLAASAATSTIGATAEPFNQTLYYSTTRYHAGGSGASFGLSSHSGMCASTFWLALRIPSSGASTMRMNFTSVGGTQTFRWNDGALAVPAGWYAITARNDCAGMPGATYTWSGPLKLN